MHRRVARQIKVAKHMALAPISSRPSMRPAVAPRRGGPTAARGTHSSAVVLPSGSAAAGASREEEG